MSHPGYLPGCHVHIHAVFPKNDIFRMSSERWGWGRTSLDELHVIRHNVNYSILVSPLMLALISQNVFYLAKSGVTGTSGPPSCAPDTNPLVKKFLLVNLKNLNSWD